MYPTLKKIRLFAIAAAATAVLVTYSPGFGASAQTSSTPVAEATIKALQEALNKQGITVNVDGVLNDDTRVAIRKYQSQHHVPVTGEPDKTTLDKLGVRTSASPAPTLAQAAPTPPATSSQQQPSPAPPASSMMMDCPMMQGQMQTMMQDDAGDDADDANDAGTDGAGTTEAEFHAARANATWTDATWTDDAWTDDAGRSVTANDRLFDGGRRTS